MDNPQEKIWWSEKDVADSMFEYVIDFMEQYHLDHQLILMQLAEECISEAMTFNKTMF